MRAKLPLPAALPSRAVEGAPERILTGATVWTGEGGAIGARSSWAVALHGPWVRAVGPAEEVLNLRGPDTEVVSLEGRFLMPGFVDAHVHLLAGGLGLKRVDLRGADSPGGLIRRVAERAADDAGDGWILGGGWNEHRWGGELPHRSWLDSAAPGRPVLLLRTDLHVGVASSAALDRAGIGDETPDPVRGRIDREEGSRRLGRPTGILRERALDLVTRVVPPPSRPEREAALAAAAGHALSHGITQVHDMGALEDPEESWASLEALECLEVDGGLPLRVLAAVPLAERERLADRIRGVGTGSTRLRWGLVKGFVDGSLGAATAWFHERYLDDPSSAGGPVTDLEELRRGILEAVALGLQPAIHAIGDRAVDWLLEVFRRAAERNPTRNLRLRVEHAQHLTPRGIRGAAHPAVFLSVQPSHLMDDGLWAEGRIGRERLAGAFPFGSLGRAGARMALGSDWPVAPLDPREALAAAVGRRLRGRDDEEPWGGREACLSLEEALRHHTVGGARVGAWEEETGTLAPGRRADLVVLSPNPLTLDPAGLLRDLRVVGTYVDGRPAWGEGVPAGGGSDG